MTLPVKTCSKCGQRKKLEDFYKSKYTKDGRKSACKVCERKHAQKKRRENKNHWDTKDRKNNLKKLYGMTVEEYDQMFEDQNGVCAICGQLETRIHIFNGLPQRLAIDHNHETGKIRGLLCSKCNLILGQINDDGVWLINALQYLKKYEEQ